MLDGNTAALHDHMRRQDKAESDIETYRETARHELEDALWQEPRLESIIDTFADDIFDALGSDESAFREAAKSRDEAEVGRYIIRAMDGVTRRLISEDAIQDRAQKIAKGY